MRLRWGLIFLVGGVLTTSLSGQPGRYGWPYGPGYGGVVVGGGFGYSRGGLRVGGGFVAVSPYALAAPRWRPYSSLTVVSIYSPPPPTVVVVQAPPIVLEGPGRGREPDDPRVPEVPRIPEAKKQAAKEAPKKPAPKPEIDPERFFDIPAEPAGVEHARLVKEGKEAFASGAYGLAAQRFLAATRLQPDVALPYFLLGEASVAVGKYHDASEAIVAGLGKAPDWPAGKFRPRELYGEDRDYTDHQGQLDGALRRHPRDPVLLFLKGHRMWFAGEQTEAVALFRRALPRFADKVAIGSYLAALPPAKP